MIDIRDGRRVILCKKIPVGADHSASQGEGVGFHRLPADTTVECAGMLRSYRRLQQPVLPNKINCLKTRSVNFGRRRVFLPQAVWAERRDAKEVPAVGAGHSWIGVGGDFENFHLAPAS